MTGELVGYWWIAVPIALVLVLIAALLLVRSRRKESSLGDVDEAATLVAVASELQQTGAAPLDEVFTTIALVPETTAIDRARLSKISNKTVIARINQVVPTAAETAARTASNTALKNTGVLYKAILPPGSALAKSRTMEGAFRGFARSGRDFSSTFRNHANFVPVDLSKTAALTSVVPNAMNVASLVVGQYYMSEISDKLETLTTTVDRIGDFQQSEFKSRIMSLIAHVAEISQFSSEIMEDETQRNTKLETLEHLRRDATELLGQVNITIDGIRQKHPDPKYVDYRSAISEFAIQLGYQNALIVVLEEISNLTYLLGRGSIPSDQTRFLLDKYLEQSVQTRTRLREWHNGQVERLHIDLGQERRGKSGFDAVLAAPLGLFDGKYRYRQLEQGLAHEIGTQANPVVESTGALNEVYDEDVEIVIKDGSYYYLREASDSRVNNMGN